MKKFILVVTIFLLGFASVYSQQAGKITLGLRGGVQIGIHEAGEDFKAWSTANHRTVEGLPAGNIVVYGGYNFTNYIGLQTELSFSLGQGLKSKYDSDHWVNMTYSSLDIPLLFRVNFLPESEFHLGILGGPYFTTPLGKVSTKYKNYTSSDQENDITTPNMGMAIGLVGGPNLGGIGNFYMDIRYITDFGESKEKLSNGYFKFMTRRGIVISAGLEIYI